MIIKINKRYEFFPQMIKSLYKNHEIRSKNIVINKDKTLTNRFHIVKKNEYFKFVSNQFKSNKNKPSNFLCKGFSSIDDSTLHFKKSIRLGGDFYSVVVESSIYVDKTLFVKEIIEDNTEVILITMPRRWGKSINLNMLYRFLSIEFQNGKIIKNKNTSSYKLFAGGIVETLKGSKMIKKVIPISNLVAQEPEYLNLQGNYPVIYLDLKELKQDNFEKIKNELKEKITETIDKFGYLINCYDQLNDSVSTINDAYKDLLIDTKSGNFTKSLLKLCSLLHSYHKNKVWILIDEYDAVVNDAYLEFTDKEAVAVSNLLRQVLEPTLKSNPFLNKAVLTGVQYICKSGIMSGLNNISMHNITSPIYSKYYGIDSDEMEKLFHHFEIDHKTALKIKDWYNGYKFNIGCPENPKFISKYNIWSIANYLSNPEFGFRAYWQNSGSFQTLFKKFFKIESLRNYFENLINGNSIKIFELIDNFEINDFNLLKNISYNSTIDNYTISLVFSYLFIAGYLTINEKAELHFPNKEIQYEMRKYLISFYLTSLSIPIELFTNQTLTLNKIFYLKDKEIPKVFINEFGTQLDDIVKLIKFIDKDHLTYETNGVYPNEEIVHMLIGFVCFQLKNANFGCECHTIKKDGKNGITDILLINNDKGMIIEMKFDSSKKEDTAKHHTLLGLKQAKSYINLIDNLSTKIFIACNITNKNQVFIFGEIITKDKKSICFQYPLEKQI